MHFIIFSRHLALLRLRSFSYFELRNLPCHLGDCHRLLLYFSFSCGQFFLGFLSFKSNFEELLLVRLLRGCSFLSVAFDRLLQFCNHIIQAILVSLQIINGFGHIDLLLLPNLQVVFTLLEFLNPLTQHPSCFVELNQLFCQYGLVRLFRLGHSLLHIIGFRL